MPTERICMSMILLEPAYKILHTFCEVQAADHFSSRVSESSNPESVASDNPVLRKERLA
jgi:hypothetical protein